MPHTLSIQAGLPGLVASSTRRHLVSRRARCRVIACRFEPSDLDRICPHGCPGRMESKQPVRTSVMDLPLGTDWTRLDLTYPVLRCRNCGATRTARPDWLDATRPLTGRLVAMIEHESHRLSATEVARRTGVDQRTVSLLLDEAIRRWTPIAPPHAPQRLGIDEAHIGGKDRGVVVDLDTGHLIALLEGRSREDFQAFFATMESRDAVRVVAIDMTRGYATLAARFFPGAQVVVDRWHVTQMARAVVNTWRMRISKPKASPRAAASLQRRRRSPRQKRNEPPRPTVLRAMLQKRSGRLLIVERQILAPVLADNPELRIAYEMREGLFDVFDEEDREKAGAMLDAWLSQVDAVVGQVPQLRDVANAVRSWCGPIMAYWSTDWTTNGMTENTNGRIKRIHREGRTMSFERLRAKAMYRLGGRPPESYLASDIARAINTLSALGWSMEDIRLQIAATAFGIRHPEAGLLDMPGRCDGG
ncbi:hypothetical protein WV31_04740 [Magnetospirillum sp. ME-1]|uniref:ISL3 family transposase n=1 Tax=Magnetospirillum sp. ME-1 TaxID=1639348 RepID=UPI000A17C4B0|nr:ISL3 family transposase [Magnetospirillum sp. ME-1]ARJ65021.1 hypothetical protein WV31_04740 [Magnetospirillum sp. ME-1]